MRLFFLMLSLICTFFSLSAFAQDEPFSPPCPAPLQADAMTSVDRVFAENQQWSQPADRCSADCGSDIWTRKSLSNYLCGIQPKLAEQGITYGATATQFYQGVSSGGAEQTFRYGGKIDQYLIFDSEKLGLWEGASLILHAETTFGENSIFDAAGLAPINFAFLTPRPNEHDTAITNLMLQQQLGGGWALAGGRINAVDLWAMLYPEYGKGLDGFMNMSLLLPVGLVPTVPLVFNGAGILKAGDRGVEAALLVLDPTNIPTRSNLDNLFDNGSTIVGLGRLYTNFGGLPGSHTVVGTYATGEYTSLDRNGFVFQPGQGLVVPQSTGSWMAGYIAQQTLWADACNEQRHMDFLTTWSFADQETSPFQWAMNASVEAYGLIPGREGDRMGVGYFYSGLSDDFKSLLPILALDDVQGAEIYYNAAITPWFHLTTDLQFVDPSLSRRDTAVVFGLRGKIDL